MQEKKVKEVWITAWGDDGNESNIFATLLGMQLHAEHAYNDQVDDRYLKRRFEGCVGETYEAFASIGQFDNTPGTDYRVSDTAIYNPSKYVLWQDLLGGLFDQHIQGLNLSSYYDQILETFKEYSPHSHYPVLMAFYMNLADVLSRKAELGIRISEAYHARDTRRIKGLLT